VNGCTVLAPQLLVKVAVAVQLAVSLIDCSRDEPEVPQPFNGTWSWSGCGPRTTREPAFSEADAFDTHELVPLRLR
jgi:hypothetical protein